MYSYDRAFLFFSIEATLYLQRAKLVKIATVTGSVDFSGIFAGDYNSLKKVVTVTTLP